MSGSDFACIVDLAEDQPMKNYFKYILYDNENLKVVKLTVLGLAQYKNNRRKIIEFL